jgi:hypothetical protein
MTSGCEARWPSLSGSRPGKGTLGMPRMLLCFGLLVAALGCLIATYGAFSIPTTVHQGNAETAQIANHSNSDGRQDAGQHTSTKIGPFWQWFKDREGAVTALSTLLLMAFTAALVFATIKLYQSGEHTVAATRQVAEAAKESADAAKLAQRPWVSVVAEIGPRGLYFDVNGANLDLLFRLKNTGNTPAITVRIEGGPRIDVKINDRMTELEKICSTAKSKEPSPKTLGYTIFPGDVLPLHMTYSFAGKEYLEQIANAQHGFIIPIVIGCVDYFLTFGEPVHHQSRFVYELDYPTPEGGSRAISVADGDKAANVLRLSPSLEAGSFQAD